MTMGLDTIAYKEFKDGEHVEADSEWFAGTESLCRGCLTGGLAWIRGKVYATIVEEISGISLYTETLSNEAVKQIATSLENFIEDPLKYNVFMGNINSKELKLLAKWFRAAADNGCYLHGC
jgi:hypothetical protein